MIEQRDAGLFRKDSTRFADRVFVNEMNYPILKFFIVDLGIYIYLIRYNKGSLNLFNTFFYCILLETHKKY